jgi:hypothetical protein
MQTFFLIIAASILGFAIVAALMLAGCGRTGPPVCGDMPRPTRAWTKEADDSMWLKFLRTHPSSPGSRKDYELDHYIPLCLGGPDDEENMWFQPRESIIPWKESAEAKDEDEARLCRLVCAKEMTQEQAIAVINSKWRKP